jgi:hypothetical protein
LIYRKPKSTKGISLRIASLLLKVSARQAGTLLERKDHQEISAILATRYGYVPPTAEYFRGPDDPAA